MSKVKKLFAMIMTIAMVMGMSMTTMAASYSSTITVKGLAAGEAKTVNVYAAITLNTAKNEWVVADWAQNYITLNADKTAYVITDAAELVASVPATVTYTDSLTADETQTEFINVPVGAYVITASGTKATYAPMVAETYKEGETYMEAENVTVIAKTTGYTVDKEQLSDNFVKRGETVTFKVTTTFPTFEDPDAEGNSFKIVDEPTGLDIIGVTSVTIGSDSVAPVTNEIMKADGTTQSYTIDLSDSIGTENANAGKTVIVEYTAMVMTDQGYENTATAIRNEKDLGSDEEEGYTGDITFTKYAENGTTVLNGAEFTLAKKDASGVVGSPLSFVLVNTGEYKLALDDEAGATTTLVATNGTLKISGLDEGTYHFTETKAPEGYSINGDGADVSVTANETAHVSVIGSMTDTKLASLPGTGGIGTTIFTIGGCVIMIAAAGLFFATRKKEEQ